MQARQALAKPTSGVSLHAVVDAVGADRSIILWLALAMLLTAAAGVGAAVARARR